MVQNLVVRQPEDREEEPPVVMAEAEDQVVTADGLVEALGVIDDLTRGVSGGPTLGEVRVVREALEVQGSPREAPGRPREEPSEPQGGSAEQAQGGPREAEGGPARPRLGV